MLSRINRLGSPALFCALWVGGAPALEAQNPGHMIITGTITGPNNALIPDALVEARSLRTQTTRTTSSNEAGKFIIISTDSSGAFHMTIKARGFVPWSGDVSKKVGRLRLPLNITLQPGGTAADWPPVAAPAPALIYARAQLGAADAISVTVDVGDIIIRGTNADRIVYRTFPKVPPPTSADSPPPPGEIAARGTHEIGPDGLSIISGDSVVLEIDVPRTLKSLRLTVSREGFVSVGSFDGELSVLNAKGPVRMGGISGPMLVEARNGNIDVSIATIPSAMNFLGRNGNITITMPPDARASFNAQTHRGTVTLDSTSRVVFPPSGGLDIMTIDQHRVDVPAADTSMKVPWVVGGGGAGITITTLNGNIIIRKNLPPKQE